MSTMLSSDDVDTIRQMPVEYLEKLYPAVIKWGPQGDLIEELLLRLEREKKDFFNNAKMNSFNEREFRALIKNASNFIISDGGISREKHVQEAISFAITIKHTPSKGQDGVFNEIKITGILIALIARDLIWETHDSLSTFSSMITWDDYYTLTGFTPKSYGPLHPDDKNETSNGILRL